MERFSIAVFRLIERDRTGVYFETGGGIVFMPEPRPDDWHGMVLDLAGKAFRHPLGPCIEVGYAMLDRATLERHCRQHGPFFWQGGDR